MDFDQENQRWNPSSSITKANPDEKSSITSSHKKKGGRKMNPRRDPNKKSTRSSGDPEMVVRGKGKVPPMNFSAGAEAAGYFSGLSSSSGVTSEPYARRPPQLENVSNGWMNNNLWGGNVGCYDGRNAEFFDEEAVFNMPELVNSMAEGMLLTPPALKSGFKWDDNDDEYIYLDLWGNS